MMVKITQMYCSLTQGERKKSKNPQGQFRHSTHHLALTCHRIVLTSHNNLIHYQLKESKTQVMGGVDRFICKKLNQ